MSVAAATHQLQLEDPALHLIRDLLDRERRSLPVEIHHTYSNEFRQELKSRLKLVEDLLERVDDA